MSDIKILSKKEVEEKCDLIYIETGLDYSYIEIKLPTGEVINTKDLDI